MRLCMVAEIVHTSLQGGVPARAPFPVAFPRRCHLENPTSATSALWIAWTSLTTRTSWAKQPRAASDQGDTRGDPPSSPHHHRTDGIPPTASPDGSNS